MAASPGYLHPMESLGKSVLLNSRELPTDYSIDSISTEKNHASADVTYLWKDTKNYDGDSRHVVIILKKEDSGKWFIDDLHDTTYSWRLYDSLVTH